MKYSIKDDFTAHGYGDKVAKKVDFLLNGIISTPGIFNFDNNNINISHNGFDWLEGKIEIIEGNNVVVDFYFTNRNDESSHYQYKDGKMRYIVSKSSGLYIIKGKDNDGDYTISYYDKRARNYIENKYGSGENHNDILLNKPNKIFKSEGISPDYTYSIKLNDNNSSYIFDGTWIDECNSYMEGESYDSNTSKTKKFEKKRNKH